jgi:aldose 1-epimerase
MLNADKYTPVDKTLIPTGELPEVKGTPMDFTTATAIGARVNDTSFAQIKYGNGYDHNWVLNKPKAGEMTLAATVFEPKTGRFMEVHTMEPGIQFYCGNFLDGTNIGKSGKPYNFRNGFCLETQHYPDSPNKPNFPSVVLKPRETYKTSTIYKFTVKK